MDSDKEKRAPGDGAKLRWYERLRQSQSAVPTFAVVTVVVAAVAATLVVTQSDGQEGGRQPALSKGPQDVVRAPPLVVQAPPLRAPPKGAGPARHQGDEAQAASSAMGAGRACRNCGVVESVAQVNQHGGYRMRIRMDDGSVRTVEQRAALAAGSRVVLESGSVRPIAMTRQG